jgi:hypothetical protein
MNTQQHLDHLRSARNEVERAMIAAPELPLTDDYLAITAEIQRLEQQLKGPDSLPTRVQMPPGAPPEETL